MVKAITNNEKVCMKCLNEFDDLYKYILHERGYGSIYDGTSSKIQLCEQCNEPKIEQWFNETANESEYWEDYRCEEDIEKFVKVLPIQGREMFYNAFTSGWGSDTMDSQDWIDIELNLAPDEVYEKYCIYTPTEIKAYEERFPTCEQPVNITHDDGSQGCWCPFGANGNYGQNTDINISSECNNCEHYKLREKPIKEMDWDTYKKYEQYIRGKQYKNLFE